VRLPPKVLALAVAVASAACGDDAPSGAAAGCGPIRREALDPTFLVHVVGGQDAGIEYRSDPPTSGPHQPTPRVEGVVDEPLSRPVQVGVLERGDVLIQHRRDLAPDEHARLAALAGDGVVVAPNSDLPDAVVATAWVAKRTCSAVDVAALEDFISQRRGKGPGDEEGSDH
jgi:hypothetical protein